MKLVVVWDWNGTLLDDVSVSIRAINKLLVRRGLSLMDLERYYRTFRFPVRLYYEAMGFDFSREPFEQVAVEYHEAYASLVGEAPLREDAVASLERIHRGGGVQVVLSALEEVRLHAELERRHIRQYFAAAYGLDNMHATSKRERGVELVQNLHMDAGDSWMIGDTDHDVEVAREIGLRPIALTGGHHDERRLRLLDVPVVRSLSAALDHIGC